MLLEKAYAKYHRSYENIESLYSVRESLEHLTGGHGEHVELDHYDQPQERDDLFKNMLEWRKYRHLMACSTASSDNLQLEAILPNSLGIIPNHSYSILDVKEIAMTARYELLRLV